MRLMVFQGFTGRPPLNYGDTSGAVRRNAAGLAFVGLLTLWAFASVPAKAQQASQPGFDPRQTEKRFDDALQSGQTQRSRSALRMPILSRPETSATTKPLLHLPRIPLAGARP